jgi:hypothetical protein
VPLNSTLPEVDVSRIAAVLIVTLAAIGVAPSAAHAVPTRGLDDTLAGVWTEVLETPSTQNPFGGGGDAFACLELGGTVAPFAPEGVKSCTVRTGTKLFVTASSWECSTFEGDGTTEAQLRACAESKDAQARPTVTVDGVPTAVHEVETGLLRITLPDDNLFALPAATDGLSVAHGWVTLLHPLTPGAHTVVINGSVPRITTKITVVPGRRPASR